MMLLNQQVIVTHFKSKKERNEELQARQNDFKNVYVKNLPDAFKEEDLDNMVSDFLKICTQKSLVFFFFLEKKTYFAFITLTTLTSNNKQFKEFGQITSRKIVTGDDQKSRGFGFVAFATSEAAKAAVDRLNDTEFQGKQLYVGRAQKKSERAMQLHRQREMHKAELQSRYKVC